MENPDYGKYSITTLLELAAAFDVALVVRFAPFSELLEWDLNSDERTLRPDSYVRDVRLKQLAAKACAGSNAAATRIGSIQSLAVAAGQTGGTLPKLGSLPTHEKQQAAAVGVPA